MNIQYLRGLLSHIEEIAIIGKKVEVDGVIGQVMGLVRYGEQINLLILIYDEGFQKYVEDDEIADLCNISDMPKSNRMMMLRQRQPGSKNPFRAVSKVFIGEREFDIHSVENRRLNQQDCEVILTFTEFLRKGWIPMGIDFQDIDMLFLISLELGGVHTALPVMSENISLRFTMHNDNVNYIIEQPITVNMNGEYRDKLWFQDAVSGEDHWLQINRIYLSDMWADMKRTFDNPKLQEQMTSEQIAQAKSNFEKQFLEVCPKGMCIPIIEYECEDDIFLQFYSKDYLDATPVRRSSAMGFIIRPEHSTGILGLKLKAAVIQEAVHPDTSDIEIELFCYSRVSTCDDIVLK